MTSYPPEPPATWPPETGYEHVPGHPSAAGFRPNGYPDHPGAPDYPGARHHAAAPGYPDHPAAPRYPDPPDYPRDTYPVSGYPAMPDYPPASGYPPMPDYPPASGYQPMPDYPPAHGYRATAGYQPGYPAAGHGLGGYRIDAAPAGPATVDAAPVYPAPAERPRGARWAMLAYLTVPFLGFLVPLAIYLVSMRGSGWLRAHAAQAVNVWLTGILYDLSAAIIAAMLGLDSPRVALTVVVPLITGLWLTTLVFLVHAAAMAGRGEAYTFPRWLCSPMVRQGHGPTASGRGRRRRRAGGPGA